MTTEQQRKMLEAAAKACGFECGVYEHSGASSDQWFYVWNEDKRTSRWWNPLTNALDTAEMCAEIGICTLFFDNEHKVSCGFLAQDKEPTLAHIEPYGDSRLKAWMYAATMCAAKTQGYSE